MLNIPQIMRALGIRTLALGPFLACTGGSVSVVLAQTLTSPGGAIPAEAVAFDKVELPPAPKVDAALHWADWSGDGLLDVWA